MSSGASTSRGTCASATLPSSSPRWSWSGSAGRGCEDSGVPAAAPEPVPDPLMGLLGLLDLEPIEVNIFRGRSPDEERQRVFGGQVAGQALIAAGRTVDEDRHVHSLHAYF